MSDAMDFEADGVQSILAAKLGFATRLLFECPRISYRIGAIAAWIWPAIRLGQIEFRFNARGAPVAYATWAFLSEAVSQEITVNDHKLLHLSEWNEGTNLWIIDVVAPFGDARALTTRLMQKRFAGIERVRAIRRHPDGSVKRIVDLRKRYRADLSDLSAVATNAKTGPTAW